MPVVMRGSSLTLRLLLLLLLLVGERLTAVRGGVLGSALPSRRSDGVRSFKVMDVVAAASALEAAGRRVFHLEVGQPVSAAPPEVKAAACRAIREQVCGYTVSAGIVPLKNAIVRHYEDKEAIAQGSLSSERIVVTTGSSGGFLLVFHACFDPGDVVAVGMTCYPCYR